MEDTGIELLYDLENQNSIFEEDLKNIAMNLAENKSNEISESTNDPLSIVTDANNAFNKEDVQGNGCSNSATEDNDLSRDRTEDSNTFESCESKINGNSNENSNDKSEKSNSSSIDKTLENLNSLIDFNKRLNNIIEDDSDTQKDPLSTDEQDSHCKGTDESTELEQNHSNDESCEQNNTSSDKEDLQENKNDKEAEINNDRESDKQAETKDITETEDDEPTINENCTEIEKNVLENCNKEIKDDDKDVSMEVEEIKENETAVIDLDKESETPNETDKDEPIKNDNDAETEKNVLENCDEKIKNDDKSKDVQEIKESDMAVIDLDKESEVPSVDNQDDNAILVEDDDDEKGDDNCAEEAGEFGSDAEMDDNEDFNPLLLCPDISMDVEESLVITNNDIVNDGSSSPLPYEQAFSTFVDEMTGAEISFNLSKEEHELRLKMYGRDNPVEFTKIHCTACNVHLGSALEGQKNRFVHPLLKVLICKDCYHFYTSGEFEKDEDGSELYCRWCGQGGQVLCCSKCEFVFCKKCIRNNFGRRKLSEIKDSEEWFCFRCDTKQLMYLRATCFEFFEYVRREISRAATLNDASFWTMDHCRCCPQLSKKRGLEDNDTEKPVAKRKRKNSNIDPDYNPQLEGIDTSKIKIVNVTGASSSNLEPVPGTSGVTASKTVQSTGFIKLVPKAPTKLSTPLRIGNSIVVMGKPSSKAATQPPIKPGATIGQVRVTPTNPGYTRISPLAAKPCQMKHEWFEKTVRASARVNSNLSYTLTQLNKAQASAGSVEALATVHNKLQEILSTSINSLIQIRKNLRTEFIAGIKNVRFPPKRTIDPNDDDVILVSSTPSTSKSNSANFAKSFPQLSSEVSLLKTPKIPPLVAISKDPPTRTTTNTNINVSFPNRQYLKVRSISQLQNVTSECIIIPDDPVPTSENGTEITLSAHKTDTSNKKKLSNGDGCIVIDDEKETDVQDNKEKAAKSTEEITDEVAKVKTDKVAKVKTDKVAKVKTGKVAEDKPDDNVFKEKQKSITYNIKETPTPEIKRMLSVKVKLPLYQNIDSLIKETKNIVNGDVS